MPQITNTYRFDEASWLQAVQHTPLQPFAESLALAVANQGHALKHGHLSRWQDAIKQLPANTLAHAYDVVDGAVSIDIPLTKVEQSALTKALQGLMPWRKGPFRFGRVDIDTEWRSDWKWDRLASHISTLHNRTVLDVGCGSGYHLWRMRKAGATVALGIDPSLLYVHQFAATQHFIRDTAVQLLPLPMHALPANMQTFDTVFSMGVLYHRRDPFEHLTELKAAMNVNGELLLETLIVPGDINKSLSIEGRYANMRNIYELPTAARLCEWLSKAGFADIAVVDINQTSQQEQRSTRWMSSHSLSQALDPDNPDLTIEGHPRPLRAMVIAKNIAQADC